MTKAGHDKSTTCTYRDDTLDEQWRTLGPKIAIPINHDIEEQTKLCLQ